MEPSQRDALTNGPRPSLPILRAEGMLILRARPPSEAESIDCFQKTQRAFNSWVRHGGVSIPCRDRAFPRASQQRVLRGKLERKTLPRDKGVNSRFCRSQDKPHVRLVQVFWDKLLNHNWKHQVQDGTEQPEGCNAWVFSDPGLGSLCLTVTEIPHCPNIPGSSLSPLPDPLDEEGDEKQEHKDVPSAASSAQ